MGYIFEIKPSCKEDIQKATKKNPVLRDALNKKIEEILQNPQHYKPLKYDLAGERRVHIMKSFVLKFEIDEIRKTVTFLAFCHHDKAYRRQVFLALPIVSKTSAANTFLISNLCILFSSWALFFGAGFRGF